MRVLLPVDGSESSMEAVKLALRMQADGLLLDAVLANVQEPATLYELLVLHDPDVVDRMSAQAGLDALAPAQALLDAADVPYECEVAKGDPAHTLVEISERFGCDMVIMGASGMSGLRSAMLGSVSNEVLHASGVPVLIVKPDTSEM
jgi:nucleotide-binding universal stress UspA family protein